MRSLCPSRQFPFSYVFKHTGNNPSIKWGPLCEDGQRFNRRERKICSCTRRFSCLNKWGIGLWLVCWKVLGPGRTGKCVSDRHTQITNFPQKRKLGWFCFPLWLQIIGTNLKSLWLKPLSGEVTLPDCAANARLFTSPGLGACCVCTLCTLTALQQNTAGSITALLAFLLQRNAKPPAPEKNPFN